MFSAAGDDVLDREGSTFTWIRGQRRGQARREGQGLLSTRWDGLGQNRRENARAGERVRGSSPWARPAAGGQWGKRACVDPRPVLSRFKRVCRHLRKMAAWVDSLHFPLFQWFSQQCLCAPRKKERSRSFTLSLSARLLCAYLHCGRSVYRPHGACSVFKMGKPREEVKWGKTENQANRAQIARLNWAPLTPCRGQLAVQKRSGDLSTGCCGEFQLTTVTSEVYRPVFLPRVSL